jgi:hypothetical protein
MSVDEVYEQAVKPLGTAQRMQLVRMILNDIPDEAVIDCRDSWTDEDLADFTQAGWNQMDEEVTDDVR